MKLVHWPLMGGLLHLVQPQPAQAPPRSLYQNNVTAHPCTASVPITVLLYNGPLLCGFNVHIKGQWLSPLSRIATEDSTQRRVTETVRSAGRPAAIWRAIFSVLIRPNSPMTHSVPPGHSTTWNIKPTVYKQRWTLWGCALYELFDLRASCSNFQDS